MIGQKVGAYRVTRPIAQGGMSTVYEALHETIGQRAAVKVLHPEHVLDPDALRRLFTEARALAIMRHPDLVQIFDFGQLEDGTPYILMEFLEGQPLSSRIQERIDHGGALPLAEALRLSRQIAHALSATHDKGVVHRDLKPENIIIVPDREAMAGERVKLLDFGIAKVLEGGAAGSEFPQKRHQTLSGQILGTPVYMSPEQCQGHEISERADVYSLGVMLFEMLAGRPPFDAKEASQVLVLHITQAPPGLATLVPGVPPRLAALVDAMLAKDPGMRPPMSAVAEQLSLLSGHGGPSLFEAPTAAVPLPPAGPSRLRLLSMAAGGAIVGLMVILSLWHRTGTAGRAAIKVRPGRPHLAAAAERRVQSAPVRWTITSTPAGAQVLRISDGVIVGVTPWSEERQPDHGPPQVLLRRAGFREHRVAIECPTGCTTQVVLAAEPKAPRRRTGSGRQGGAEEAYGIGELPD